jgi:DNA recombination protein RmuC
MSRLVPLLYLLVGGCGGAVLVWLWMRSRQHVTLESEKLQRAVAETRLSDMEQAFQSQKNLLQEAESRWKDAFENLSSKALLNLQAGSRTDLSERQTSIENLLKPLKETLHQYQSRLQQSETAQTQILGQLRAQIDSLLNQNQLLGQETGQLRRILGSNQARGKWGEETLRRVIEVCGMSSHCDFVEQTMQGDGKPDLVVHLPGNRVILVDAKVPDLEFLAALDAADDTKRKEAAVNHASRLRQTIKGLADRDYPSQFPNALDYVVLFLPAESLFSIALEGDRELITWAAGKRIMLATPSSLIGVLRAVALSWQQHSSHENSEKIVHVGIELYERLLKWAEHMGKMRDQLEKTNQAFNEVVGSTERRVIPSIEKLRKLGVSKNEDPLPSLPPIETFPRPVNTLLPEPAAKPLLGRAERAG